MGRELRMMGVRNIDEERDLQSEGRDGAIRLLEPIPRKASCLQAIGARYR